MMRDPAESASDDQRSDQATLEHKRATVRAFINRLQRQEGTGGGNNAMKGTRSI